MDIREMDVDDEDSRETHEELPVIRDINEVGRRTMDAFLRRLKGNVNSGLVAHALQSYEHSFKRRASRAALGVVGRVELSGGQILRFHGPCELAEEMQGLVLYAARGEVLDKHGNVSCEAERVPLVWLPLMREDEPEGCVQVVGRAKEPIYGGGGRWGTSAGGTGAGPGRRSAWTPSQTSARGQNIADRADRVIVSRERDSAPNRVVVRAGMGEGGGSSSSGIRASVSIRSEDVGDAAAPCDVDGRPPRMVAHVRVEEPKAAFAGLLVRLPGFAPGGASKSYDDSGIPLGVVLKALLFGTSVSVRGLFGLEEGQSALGRAVRIALAATLAEADLADAARARTWLMGCRIPPKKAAASAEAGDGDGEGDGEGDREGDGGGDVGPPTEASVEGALEAVVRAFPHLRRRRMPPLAGEQEEDEEENDKEEALARVARFLAYMALRLATGKADDRDAVEAKRVHAPGDLLLDLLRQALAAAVREFKSRRGGTKSPHDLLRGYIYEEASEVVRTALWKGTWPGAWPATDPCKDVAQRLISDNRISEISHVRRVQSTLLDSADGGGSGGCRVLGPRLVAVGSYGRYCPSESPDGADVGLKKYLATGAAVSTRAPLVHRMFVDVVLAPVVQVGEDAGMFGDLRSMASLGTTPCRVFVDGDFLGKLFYSLMCPPPFGRGAPQEIKSLIKIVHPRSGTSPLGGCVPTSPGMDAWGCLGMPGMPGRRPPGTARDCQGPPGTVGF